MPQVKRGHRRKEATKCFGGIPFRAFGDGRLSKMHLSVLGVVASHDRLGNSKLGCVARRDRIAYQSDLSPSAVSKAVNDLLKLGYMSAKPHPKDGRRRAYRVIYNVEDWASFDEKTNQERVRSKGRPSRQINRRPTTQIGRQTTTQSGDGPATYLPELDHVPEPSKPVIKPKSGPNINISRPPCSAAKSNEDNLRVSASARSLSNELEEIRYALTRGDVDRSIAIERLEHIRELADACGDEQIYRDTNKLLGGIIGEDIPF